MFKRFLLAILLVAFLSSLLVLPVYAQEASAQQQAAQTSSNTSAVGCSENCTLGGLFKGLPSGTQCLCCGVCTPEDILMIVVNIMNLILGVVGSLMLIMFFYGGMLILTSGGGSKKIEEGKATLVNAVIGGILVLSSWFLVNALTSAIIDPDIKDEEEIRLDLEKNK